MSLHPHLSQISLGEDSTRQFEADVHNGISLASEMAAFANSKGGTIFIGVADNGSIPGLPVHRNGSPKTENQILTLISEDSSITTEQPGFVSGISKRAVKQHPHPPIPPPAKPVPPPGKTAPEKTLTKT